MEANPILQAFYASPSIESAVLLMDAADAAAVKIKEFREQAKQAVIEYIDREGAFSVGDRVFCVGKETTEKPTMPPVEGWKYLMDQAGGEIDAVASTLKSDCFKPGAVEKLCGSESRKKMFVKVVRTTLDEKEGTERIVKKLVRAERRFMPNVPVRGEIVDAEGIEE